MILQFSLSSGLLSSRENNITRKHDKKVVRGFFVSDILVIGGVKSARIPTASISATHGEHSIGMLNFTPMGARD